MKRSLLIPLLLILIVTCTQEQETQTVDVVDLVPQDNEISGWVRDGNMDVAENETQLYDLINGEGVVYVDNGFVKSAFQNYQGEVTGNLRDIRLRIFDMGDTLNARAVYHDSRIENGNETPWTETGHAGTEARYDENLLFDYRLDFWENRFYVEIVIYDEKTPQGLNIAKLFAINVSEAIRAINITPEN
jgi:hypothetical protein